MSNDYEQDFKNMLQFVLRWEGGYVNDPDDLGGETNKGITKSTYDHYRKNKGEPLQSVKYISDEEVHEIYYQNYYKASGADKISDKRLAFYVFDTAVNMGVSRAQSFLRECDEDPTVYEQLRRDKYTEFVKINPRQEKYMQGWSNRVNSMVNFADKNFTSKNNYLDNNIEPLYARIEYNDIKFKEIASAFSQRIRDYYHLKKNKDNEKFNKNYRSHRKSDNNQNGKWVTIDGNHVFINT